MSSCEIESFSPFVVFGASKSGTTWLQKMLDLHPEIRCHFQLPIFPIRGANIWFNAPGVYFVGKSPFKDVFPNKREEQLYFAYLEYLKKLNFTNKSFLEKIHNFGANDVRSRIEKLHAHILRIITVSILCDDSGKKIFGTKSYIDLETLFWVFPDAKLIHIVRDGRDVAVSKRFHYYRMGGYYLGDEKNILYYFLDWFKPTRILLNRVREKYGWFINNWFELDKNRRLFHKKILEKITREWKAVVEYILEYEKRYPQNVLRIRYEDLITNTPQELKKILEFLGANSHSDIVSQLVEETSFKKLKRSNDSFYRKGQSGDWKNYFNKKDKKIFKQIAGDLLIELGYEKDYNW